MSSGFLLLSTLNLSKISRTGIYYYVEWNISDPISSSQAYFYSLVMFYIKHSSKNLKLLLIKFREQMCFVYTVNERLHVSDTILTDSDIRENDPFLFTCFLWIRDKFVIMLGKANYFNLSWQTAITMLHSSYYCCYHGSCPRVNCKRMYIYV